MSCSKLSLIISFLLFFRPKVSIIGSREQLCVNNDVLKQETNSAKVRKETADYSLDKQGRVVKRKGKKFDPSSLFFDGPLFDTADVVDSFS